MRLAFQIAKRFLTHNKAQTIFIALGIAVGVSVQIFIGLLIQGLQSGLIDKTIGSSPHITVGTEEKGANLSNWKEIENQLKIDFPEITAMTPNVDGAGFLKTDSENEPMMMRGFDIEASNGIYNWNDKLKEGKLPYQEDQLLIGLGLSEKLNISVGETISVFLADGQTKEMTVSGIFDFNVKAINDNWTVTNLETAQSFFANDNKVTSLQIQIEDIFNADLISEKMSSQLAIGLTDNQLEFSNWKEQNAELLSGLNGQSVSSYMIQVFVLIAVVLGIASVLMITVLQKSKQLGILKAMGITNATASMVFLFQGMLLGLIGAIMGVGLGLGLSYSFTKFALNPDGTPVIPLNIDYGFMLLSGGIAIVSATIASIIPAINSLRLNPMEVIKNG